jgi:hypothetical protein
MIEDYVIRNFDLGKHPDDVIQYQALTEDVLRVSGDAYWIRFDDVIKRTPLEWVECCTEVEGQRCGIGGFRNRLLRASVEVFPSRNPECQKWFPGVKIGVAGRAYKHPDEHEPPEIQPHIGERLMLAAIEWCKSERGNYPVLITAMRVDNLPERAIRLGEERLLRCGFVKRNEPEIIKEWSGKPNNPAVQYWWTQTFTNVQAVPR